jgi:hypothetical protein
MCENEQRNLTHKYARAKYNAPILFGCVTIMNYGPLNYGFIDQENLHCQREQRISGECSWEGRTRVWNVFARDAQLFSNGKAGCVAFFKEEENRVVCLG